MTQPASPATPDAASAAALEELLRVLPGRVGTDPELLRERSLDRSGQSVPGLPTAVILAGSVEDVQAACRVAHAHGVPLVTRGAGTGLAGGALAGTGELVLDLSGIDRVLEINAANRLAVVQAGVINAALNERLAEHGLWWAPDPASKAISTVGGNIAMNAGGLLCAKYGVTREAVLGLKVVLADGTLIETGHRTVKGVTGYDVTALMIGSEGTLGVIVEATLKLLPAVTGPTPTLGAAFGSVQEAARAVADVSAAGLVPAAMELLDRPSLDALASHTGTDAAPGADAYLLVQTDGASGEAELGAIAEILRSHGASCSVAADQDEAHALFALRRELFPSLEALGGTLLVEDVAVPRDRLAEAFAGIRAIEERHGLSIPTAAHAGDGNLHPTFVVPGAEVPTEVWDAASELFALGLELGGTLSGEHGIGLLKRRWLKDELGEAQFALQRGIKELFDPSGILNPGKVF